MDKMNKTNRFLWLLAFLMAAVMARGQEEIIVTGSLPTVTIRSCEVDFQSMMLTGQEALDYFNECGLVIEHDCSSSLNVWCSIEDIDEEVCYTSALRRFVIISDCDQSGVELMQSVTVYYNYENNTFTLPDHYDTQTSWEDVMPANYDTEAIDAYLSQYDFQYPNCWTAHEAYYDTPTEVFTSNMCERRYLVTFHLSHRYSDYFDCSQEITVTQTVILESWHLTVTGDGMEPIEKEFACGSPSSFPPITTIEGFSAYGVTFSNYLDANQFDIHHEDVSVYTGECRKERVIRMYYISNSCVVGGYDTIIEQNIYYYYNMDTQGNLNTLYYDENEGVPEPYTRSPSPLESMRKAGLRLVYFCDDLENIWVNSWDEQNWNGNEDLILRHYHLYHKDCGSVESDVLQVLQKVNKNPNSFKLQSYTDTSSDDAKDGTATLSPPEYLECGACTGCPDRQLFKVRWTNLTEDKIYETDPNDENCDIYYIDTLMAGDYKVEVFPICNDPDLDPSKPVYSEHFKIQKTETKLYVVIGAQFYSSSAYVSAFGLHRYTNGLPPGVSYEGDPDLLSPTGVRFACGSTIDINSQYSVYGWNFTNATTDFSDYEMQSAGSSSGTPFYDWVNGYRRSYRQHFTVAKLTDSEPLFTFQRYSWNGESLRDQSSPKSLYYSELSDSEDPNEIVGPAGYTDADSTVVQMINATDDMGYTIRFENDPEFATAAAARVKITCPLDEHADPTTFRLGTFGFGEYTFEVPALASYYNNRINMDSLGYWLDVTASIAVPENEAYWIFQTIDPATGVAPIDTLGFLPVNDTLTGIGEGFVTFTVAPKAGNNRSQIATGDTIVEQADIFFDENEVVPTNRYKNVFDAVAPTSVIVCDTTGAFGSRVLDIAFDAADDEYGSGLRYVELYANIDLAGYALVANVHPDSTYHFHLMNGTNFEFMGLAVDNVGNKEPYKPYHELYYSFANPPYDLQLSNSIFAENDAVGTAIGTFTTFDDQNTDNFGYALVDGEGSDDNNLFVIEGNVLKTNFDFRCYGTYNYTIRVRTTDITNAYLEKVFALAARETETAEVNYVFENLCQGQSVYFGGEYLTQEGAYFDTLSNHLGCDSIVCLRISVKPAPVTTEVADVLCFGNDYTDNGFNLTVDSLTVLTQGWTMEDEITLNLDNYVENAYGCFDTTRLALTLRPTYEVVSNVQVCENDLPYIYYGLPFREDTTVVRNFTTAAGCDSILILNLTVNPAGTQSDNLASGWNWYSTYIDQSNGQGLTNLENALGTHGRTIKSKTQFVQYSPELNGWYGNLNEIDGLSMYQIETDEAHTMDLSGCNGTPDSIMLHNGWSWISYPLPSSMYVSQTPSAISGYPTDGDIFKAKSSFAMYYADYGMWFGTLSVLDPGQGYMYNSNSDADKYLYYPNASRAEGHPVEIPQAHWVNNVHHFADNITFLGVIELDGQTIESDTLEVGVFCNGEERGSGRALYLEEMDAFRIFLTVQGKDGDELSFRLFDHSRDKERRIRCRQQVIFHADDHYGDPKHPYHFCFATDYDKHIVAEICEGQYYVENGFRVYQPGTYFKELTGQYGNDSIIRLDLTVNQVYQYEEEVVAVEFPFHYGDKVFDNPGTYTLPFQTEHGCDSVLVVKVEPYEGLRELLVSPVPANRGERVTLYFPFTREEQQNLQVEVYTLAGGLMQYIKPTRYPIELEPITVSGTYMVKVTMGTGEVVTGKIIVR